MITSFFVPKKTREPCESMTNETEGKRARDLSPSRVETSKKPMLSRIEELLSHLHDDNDNNDNDNNEMNSSWKSALERYTSSQSCANIA